MATAARSEARKLQALSYDDRKKILYSVASALIDRKEELLEANKKDIDAAGRDDVALPLVRRLKLSDEKLNTLATGIRQIADQEDPLGVVKSKREVADGLELSQITVPIGVLMIIFESRPDSMPQISALALASGNGLLLKGGKEAIHSNAALHKVIGDAIESGSDGQISRDIIALVTSRGQVADMLNLDDVIDLVIPRGGNELVQYIKQNTRIPVLGHADGICHVYVDKDADLKMAVDVAVDSKCQYEASCNAAETLLVHEDVAGEFLPMAKAAFEKKGVELRGCEKTAGIIEVKKASVEDWKTEYLDYILSIKVVGSFDEAVEHINNYGSGHTDAIVTANKEAAMAFMDLVDAGDVFWNCSTRFSDGFRYGLGAEVGISTNKIHARGPVGLEGLLIYKWRMIGNGQIVADYGGADGKKFTHRKLDKNWNG